MALVAPITFDAVGLVRSGDDWISDRLTGGGLATVTFGLDPADPHNANCWPSHSCTWDVTDVRYRSFFVTNPEPATWALVGCSRGDRSVGARTNARVTAPP